MEGAVAHATRELESLHDELHDVLEVEDYDALARSHTDAIPSASTSAELKCIMVAIDGWERASWISSDARVAIANRMKASCLAANAARAAAVAEEAALADVERAGESGSRDEAGAARQPATLLSMQPIMKKSRTNQSIALQMPVQHVDQRSIATMMGAKTFSRTVRNTNGQKVQQSMEVVTFAPHPFAPPRATWKCSFGCGESFASLQARIGHEIHRHNGRDGLSRGSADVFGMAKRQEAKLVAQSVIESVILPAVMACVYQLELERNPQEREGIEAAQRECEAEEEAKRAADALAQAERARRMHEREEAGGGRRGEIKRHQYTAKDKLRLVEVFDRIRFDTSIRNKGEAFKNETGVSETNVLKWAKPEERANISRGGAYVHAQVCDSRYRNS